MSEPPRDDDVSPACRSARSKTEQIRQTRADPSLGRPSLSHPAETGSPPEVASSSPAPSSDSVGRRPSPTLSRSATSGPARSIRTLRRPTRRPRPHDARGRAGQARRARRAGATDLSVRASVGPVAGPWWVRQRRPLLAGVVRRHDPHRPHRVHRLGDLVPDSQRPSWRPTQPAAGDGTVTRIKVLTAGARPGRRGGRRSGRPLSTDMYGRYPGSLGVLLLAPSTRAGSRIPARTDRGIRRAVARTTRYADQAAPVIWADLRILRWTPGAPVADPAADPRGLPGRLDRVAAGAQARHPGRGVEFVGGAGGVRLRVPR